MWRFTVEEALQGAVFDNDVSLSKSESSEDGEGDDLYALLREPVVQKK